MPTDQTCDYCSAPAYFISRPPDATYTCCTTHFYRALDDHIPLTTSPQ